MKTQPFVHPASDTALCSPIRPATPLARAFTLIEMLVVIIVIIIIVLITVPAFQAMIYSNGRIQAEEGLKAGLALGRDAAVRGGDGEDAAAVFIYEPGSGMKIVACRRVGSIQDIDLNRTGADRFVQRDVFVPISTFEPVALPKIWTVRGYAGGAQIDAGWYELVGGDPRYPVGEPSWVFPETGFFDSDLNAPQTDGLNRQTFMVRFSGGSGAVTTASPEAALVVYPRDSRFNRSNISNGDLRLDTSKDKVRTVRRIMADRVSITPDQRRQLLGEGSGDCILVKSVTQVALMDETKLAAALGVRVNQVTGCIYQASKFPVFVTAEAGGSNLAVTAQRINRWIEGDTNLDGRYTAGMVQATVTDEPLAKIFVLDRFLGGVQQVVLTPASGVAR